MSSRLGSGRLSRRYGKSAQGQMRATSFPEKLYDLGERRAILPEE